MLLQVVIADGSVGPIIQHASHCEFIPPVIRNHVELRAVRRWPESQERGHEGLVSTQQRCRGQLGYAERDVLALRDELRPRPALLADLNVTKTRR